MVRNGWREESVHVYPIRVPVVVYDIGVVVIPFAKLSMDRPMLPGKLSFRNSERHAAATYSSLTVLAAIVGLALRRTAASASPQCALAVCSNVASIVGAPVEMWRFLDFLEPQRFQRVKAGKILVVCLPMIYLLSCIQEDTTVLSTMSYSNKSSAMITANPRTSGSCGSIRYR